jgi:predicted homoserine dehydrogenase-like protein
MNLRSMLDAHKPVRVGLIGAGKFGSMFLAQVPTIAGIEVAVIADIDAERATAARASLTRKARAANVIYSMAYGGRPALFAEMVDLAYSTILTVAAE